jgi:hypothetical protein
MLRRNERSTARESLDGLNRESVSLNRWQKDARRRFVCSSDILQGTAKTARESLIQRGVSLLDRPSDVAVDGQRDFVYLRQHLAQKPFHRNDIWYIIACDYKEIRACTCPRHRFHSRLQQFMLAAGEKCTKNYFLLAVEMEQKIGSTEPVNSILSILSYMARGGRHHAAAFRSTY